MTVVVSTVASSVYPSAGERADELGADQRICARFVFNDHRLLPLCGQLGGQRPVELGLNHLAGTARSGAQASWERYPQTQESVARQLPPR